MSFKKIYLVLMFSLSNLMRFGSSFLIYRIPVGELFATKIEPKMFNWTFQGVTEQFTYRPSLEGYPDLPLWMRFMYSPEYHAGFIYGTPPEQFANKELRLDIVALNKQNYETRSFIMVLNFIPKFPPAYIVQMKIDNLNWVHLMDPGRLENLKNIFRNELWPNSQNDLHLVFMESAVKMGGRLPLKPQQREGVIVHLGSNTPLSQQLIDLQDEVRPLYKLTTCAYKRTSVQKTFENVGFKLDWCGFHILGNEATPEVLYHNHGVKSAQGSAELTTLKTSYQWNGLNKKETPQRIYIEECAFSVAIPVMVLAILVGILSAVLCFQNQNAILIPITAPTVQMVQCSDSNNQPTSTLKSLKDPNMLIDNISIHSQSPCSSLCRNDSPHNGNTYLRPKPPPYKPSSIGKRTADI